ncbi:DUF1837 domain-containing protein [Shouchella clausii]|uniref:HamA C-terminal domain-containing protein n=1 Tax=Shouchella TaxID=2893057 RepID=UPI0004E625A0|nr:MULTISPECIES: DUF1837 domain-containing protein [Shouchella]ALA52920.1 hypothetical protein DB29_02092 [Shouchella clausii]MBU3231516.1 DUF1837 domain-containing protein [Shouchella clausii]MBU3263480.1 DUF1837 domain-containing protein [Shouchella clausii]MBU3507871.1 DUF1837 domain-containing protein [Shouchella clausii]MBU3536096.1 DUF1837 domain-containing protein [Shouchella clausii]
MNLSITSNDFLKIFKHLSTHDINNTSSKVNLFLCPINANKFDYNRIIEELIEPVADFAISRKVKKSYSNKPMKLSKVARERFVEYKKNTGELGEFLLYCFLEGHLNAPKIFSKLEMKTSTSMYVNGSDGVHFLKIPDGNYQLVFGESKTIKGLRPALNDAFKSIYQFITEVNDKGAAKSGINFEKRLISDNLDHEIWSEEEKKFLTKLIYPTSEEDFNVDDAFGIFVGFQINLDGEERKLGNNEYRKKVEAFVKSQLLKELEQIEHLINKYNLYGYSFYVYALPFTELDKAREQIMKGLTT